MNLLRWNARQRIALLCGGLVTVGMVAVPPWRVAKHHRANVRSPSGIRHFAGHAGTTVEFAGYGPLLAPPHSAWETSEDEQPTISVTTGEMIRRPKPSFSLFGPYRYESLSFQSVYTVDWALLLLQTMIVWLIMAAAIYDSRGRPSVGTPSSQSSSAAAGV